MRRRDAIRLDNTGDTVKMPIDRHDEVEDEKPDGWIDPAKMKLTDVGLLNMWLFRALNDVEWAEGGYVGVKYIQGKR